MSGPFDLEAEVRDLAARRDITGAVQRYMRGLDRLDPVLQATAFHADSFVDCGLMAGPVAEFITFAQGFLGDLDASQHFLGQIQIDLHGDDTASGECYFQAWHGLHDEAGNPRDLFIAGRYVDEYTCKNGEWRIAKRKLITDWVKNDPADHSFYVANPTTNRPGRRGEDFSQTRDWPS
ncbi:nuclear transport factor 2 family protein [Novosphingobium lentum]|uniref:nuclear transport factor 2 family protein n=1 Tax=Novosphingobium lentum TaxID=145287 RepID=UPI00082D56A7|nr:nuclear transport factor 2 family protein [Novosphingobium lentum]